MIIALMLGLLIGVILGVSATFMFVWFLLAG